MQRLLEGRCLLEGDCISMWIPKDAALIRGQHLFEARSLLEEIKYSILDQNNFENIHQNKLLPKGTLK